MIKLPKAPIWFLVIAYFLTSFQGFAAINKKEVSYEFLNNDSPITDFIDTSVFASENLNEKISLPNSGHLDIFFSGEKTRLRILLDHYSMAKNPRMKITQLPMLKFDFIVDQNYLVPRIQNVQRSDHPYWEWQVSPGRFWKTPGDRGFTRVAFPFSLQEKNANCTHNGLLLFLMNEQGETSNGVFQIASETCAYLQFDLAGRVEVDYESKIDIEDKALKEYFKKAIAEKIVWEPVERLTKKYPKLNIKNLLPPQPLDSTISGLVIDGEHYSLNCGTRHGKFPYCDWMALPSYSTAKSIFAGIGYMRLQKLVPNIERLLVTKIIPECSKQKWENVTLSDLINMRTGNYLSKGAHGDEGSDRMTKFFLSTTHQDKLDLACNMFPHKAKPGKVFKYHTSDTYLAGVMLDRVFEKVSDQSDFYQSVLANDLWFRLGLSPLLNVSKRTYDKDNQAFAGWGLTYYTDDILKIGHFLQQQKTATGEKLLLDKKLLASAMQQFSATNNREGGEPNLAYNNGFWALEVGSVLGCKKPYWIPFMSGFGGITVALISDNIIYYNFSDNHQYLWLNIVKELNKQFAICEAT